MPGTNEVHYAYADPEGSDSDEVNDADADGLYDIGTNNGDNGYMETGGLLGADGDARYSDPVVNQLFRGQAGGARPGIHDYARPRWSNAGQPAESPPAPPARPSLKFVMQSDFYNGIDTDGRPMPQPVYEPMPPPEKGEGPSAGIGALIVSMIAVAMAVGSFAVAFDNRIALERLENRSATTAPSALASASAAGLVPGPGMGSVVQWTHPVGAVQFFVTDNLPASWLVCDGAVYNVSAWPELAAALGRGPDADPGWPNRTTFAVPDIITDGLYLRGGGPADIGTTEASSVAADDIRVRIRDPGHTHPTMFEGNYGTKGPHYIRRNQFDEYPGMSELHGFSQSQDRSSNSKVFVADPTLFETGVSAEVEAGNETRPPSIRLLPAVYGGRPGGR